MEEMEIYFTDKWGDRIISLNLSLNLQQHKQCRESDLFHAYHGRDGDLFYWWMEDRIVDQLDFEMNYLLFLVGTYRYNSAGKVIYFMLIMEEMEIYFTDEWGDRIVHRLDFEMNYLL